MTRGRQYWLVKTEPESFSIDDLAASPDQTTFWDGVRNYQARNYLRDQMQPGDGVLFYHSNADPPAIMGITVVVRGGYPDYTAWEPGQHHFDPQASPENPIWQMVDLKLESIFSVPLPLDLLRTVPALSQMELLRKGSRLSVQPVRESEYQAVLELARQSARRAADAPPDIEVNSTVGKAGRLAAAQSRKAPVAKKSKSSAGSGAVGDKRATASRGKLAARPVRAKGSWRSGRASPK